jgi:uncharacterized membrane protein YhaH (DUF805 family)
MIEAIKHNLAHLADFSGREGRRSFWLWFLAIAIVNVVVSIGLSARMTAGAMSTAFQSAQQGVDPAAVETIVVQQMLEGMPTLVYGSIALSVFNVIMLGAAFVRRLHDSGLATVFVLLPLAAAIAAALLSLQQLSHMQELVRMTMEAQAGGNLTGLTENAGWQSLVGWLPLLLVIGFGVRKSDPADNRWGPPPAS